MGSAFNPPHIGHLALAREAAWTLGLERVLLVPTGVAPHKEIAGDPGREARMELTRLAAEADPLLEVSDVEVARAGPSYTYETLEHLAARDPGGGLYLILGADAALGLPQWKWPERIVAAAGLAVARRAGIGSEELEGALRQAGAEIAAGAGAEQGGGRGDAGRAVLLDMPAIGISSSMLRERAAAGRPIRYLTPDPVAEAVDSWGIYGGVDDGCDGAKT